MLMEISLKIAHACCNTFRTAAFRDAGGYDAWKRANPELPQFIALLDAWQDAHPLPPGKPLKKYRAPHYRHPRYHGFKF